jgi:copper(I)-binding protein
MKRLALVLAATLAAAVSRAQDKSLPKSSKISVVGAWARAVPPASNVSAVYMTIKNESDQPAYLESARTPAAKSTEIHKMGRSGSMMTMAPVDNVPIPAHGQAPLEPNGYHMMLIGLKRALKSGDLLKLTLRFRGGGVLKLTVPVRSEDEVGKEEGH